MEQTSTKKRTEGSADAQPNTLGVMSVIATTSGRLRDLVIKDGQLIFVHDVGRVALDLKGKRTFYNQIIELESELERLALTDAVNGRYYFVLETAVLWRYSDGWVQISGSTSEETVFIGDSLPELGTPKTLYVDKTKKEISVWNDDGSSYMVVADKTDIATVDDGDIESLFA